MRRLVCLLLVFSCTATTASESASVRDDAGLDVVVARPARRVVSLAPHLTELLYEIGAGDAVVGATRFSDYPAAAAALPRVGGLGNLDAERLVALAPDLVVLWSSGTAPAELAVLARLGVPVFRSEPHSLDDVARTMERLGTLTGHEATASAAAAGFRDRVAALRATYAARAPVRVFFQVWGDPLMTVGGAQLVSQVIALCGGRNVFAALTVLAPVVDVEAVIAADPQLIATTADDGDHGTDLARWRRWTGVSAVRDGRYLFLQADEITRQSSRVLGGAEKMCAAIDAVRRR